MTEPCRDDICITCADALLPVVVEWLSEDGCTARGLQRLRRRYLHRFPCAVRLCNVCGR